MDPSPKPESEPILSQQPQPSATSSPEPTGLVPSEETPEVSPEPSASPEPAASPEPNASPEPAASPEPNASPEPAASPEPTPSETPFSFLFGEEEEYEIRVAGFQHGEMTLQLETRSDDGEWACVPDPHDPLRDYELELAADGSGSLCASFPLEGLDARNEYRARVARLGAKRPRAA